MLTLKQIRNRLEDRNIQAVSRKTGLHFNTLHRIKRGETTPSYATLERLSAYLEDNKFHD